METGMMWLDTDGKRSLDEKVQRAVDHYREKYGRLPELCLVNSKLIADDTKVGRVLVQPCKTVLPGHFWLGVAN
jgi:hypothetical protein